MEPGAPPVFEGEAVDAAHVLGIGDPVVAALHQRHDLVVRLPKQPPRLAEEGAHETDLMHGDTT